MGTLGFLHCFAGFSIGLFAFVSSFWWGMTKIDLSGTLYVIFGFCMKNVKALKAQSLFLLTQKKKKGSVS